MLLKEFLDSDVPFREIPPEDFEQIGLPDELVNICRCMCVFEISDKLYLSYLIQPETFDKDSYAFNFAYISEDGYLHHELMNKNDNSIKVYSGVLSSLVYMINKINAKVVVMHGHEDRQHALYQKLCKRLQARYPQFEVDAEKLIIRRNPV